MPDICQNPLLKGKNKKVFMINQHNFESSNLMFYTPFTGDATDQSGNNIGTTLFGSPSLSTPQNNALNLTTGKYMVIDDNNKLSFTDGVNDKPFSIGFLIKGFPYDSANSFILTKRNANSNPEYQISFSATTGLRLDLFSEIQSTVYTSAWTAGFSWDSGTEYDILVTYNGSGANTGIKIYINGTDEVTTRGGAGVYQHMNPGVATIKVCTYTGTNLFWSGYIDEIKIYNEEIIP